MKKTIFTIALFAVFSVLSTSCQKENDFYQIPIMVEQTNVYKVCYSIDGKSYQITLIGDKTWHDFLSRMFAMAEKGHIVSFRIDNSSSQVASTKEVVTYTTSSQEDAYKWAEKKVNEGYSVTVEYDERTGKYICTAIK